MTKRYVVEFVPKGSDVWQPDSYFDDESRAIEHCNVGIQTNKRLAYGRVVDTATGEFVTGLIMSLDTHAHYDREMWHRWQQQLDAWHKQQGQNAPQGQDDEQNSSPNRF